MTAADNNNNGGGDDDVPLATPEQLPIIDISPLFLQQQQGDAADGTNDTNDTNDDTNAAAVAAIAAAMRDACTRVGFFYITGLPEGVADTRGLFEAARALIALPPGDKAALDARLSPLHRGWTGVGGAHNCVPEDACDVGPDNKESFLLGAEGDRSPMHGVNPWPPEALLPGWHDAVGGYFAAALAVSRAVARGLALSLGLDARFFTSRMRDPVAQLLLLRYPPPPPPPAGGAAGAAAAAAGEAGEDGGGAATTAAGAPHKDGAALEQQQQQQQQQQRRQFVGCGAHTDCGFLTLLAQDGTPGLQVQLASGGWVAAPAVPRALLVNLGDMAAFWSNGLYKSTLHRVFNASAAERYSAPFFCNCDFDAEVRPLAAVAEGDDAAAGAAPVLAGHYILKKLGLMYDQ